MAAARTTVQTEFTDASSLHNAVRCLLWTCDNISSIQHEAPAPQPSCPVARSEGSCFHYMLRVSPDNVLIVPPFECAWLYTCEYGLNASDGCCLDFDAKGENDVTIILRPSLGARRWQHLGRGQGGDQLVVEDNYTIILGSHRNSRLKLERNGETVAEVHGDSSPKVSSALFTHFWISYSSGVITVGSGQPGSHVACQWQDPTQPAPLIQHVGFSCWDKHVSYRNVSLSPPLPPLQLRQRLQQQQQQTACQEADGWAAGADTSAPGEGDGSASPAVPSLLQLAMEAVAGGLSAATVCDVLQLAELLLPTTEALYCSCLQLLARHAGALLASQPEALGSLSWDVLVDLLQQPLLGMSERQAFDLVALWCGCGPVPAAVAAAAGSPIASSGASGPHLRYETVMEAADDRPSSPAAGVALQADQAATASPSLAASANGGVGGTGGPRSPVLSSRASSTTPPTSPAAATHATGRLSRVASSSSWFKQAPCPEDAAHLVSLVRFVLMSQQELEDALRHPLVQQYPSLADIILQQQQHYNASSGAIEPPQQLGAAAYPSDHPAAGPSDPAAAACLYNNRSNSATQRLLSRHMLQQQGSLGSQHSADLSAATLIPPADAAVGSSTGAAVSSAMGTGTTAASSSGAGAAPAARPGRVPQRRFNPRCTELMYVFPGDKNGVVWHLATEYGTQQWVNPVLSKRLTVRASSPASRYTDPKVVVSGQFSPTSWAGPRYSSGRPSTWWELDLGPAHRLLCNYYCMRQDGSTDFARHWVLQGSVDGAHWVDLRRHVGDATLKLSGQYASWPVTGPAAAVPFRAFRVLLTGPTVSLTAPWNLCLCYLELYGYLYKLDQA